ncbi:MAG TPA: glucokinase [Pseudolabrys sp.]|jgi:glucokinase|nr:glucokinase [Pseudolabrys sp.]
MSGRGGGQRVLLGDIGGTNARFAVLHGAELEPIVHIPAAAHLQFTDALRAFLSGRERADAAVLAVAGVVDGGRCALTNNPWVVDAAELQIAFDFSRVRLINDFEAIAWALPHFSGADLCRIGGGEPAADAPIAVLGPGTGLGVAAWLPHGGGAVLTSEGGHATLAGASPREDAVIAHLRRRFGHVSAERALSGPGLENLYNAIAALDGAAVPARNAAAISQAAASGECAVCRAALDMFCALLGDVAGNLALAFGARGGVTIAGGIVPRLAEELVRSAFRTRFESKGRMRAYVEPIPVNVVMHADPAFVGLKGLARSIFA